MTDQDTDSNSDDDRDIERQLREAAQAQADLLAAGWVWQGADQIQRVLAHPSDPAVNIWFDPYTGKQLLSPRLVEALRREVEAERRRTVD